MRGIRRKYFELERKVWSNERRVKLFCLFSRFLPRRSISTGFFAMYVLRNFTLILPVYIQKEMERKYVRRVAHVDQVRTLKPRTSVCEICITNPHGVHVQNRHTYIGQICWGYGIQKLAQSIPGRLCVGKFARKQGDIGGYFPDQHTTAGDNGQQLCGLCPGPTHSPSTGACVPLRWAEAQPGQPLLCRCMLRAGASWCVRTVRRSDAHALLLRVCHLCHGPR